MENKVISYYDDYTEKQIEFGISKRNLKIQEWTEKFGLETTNNVLEIGCGIGTQTELLAEYLIDGKITAIDISPKSVEIAKQRLKKFKQVSFITGDIITLEYSPDNKFDVIVLPDVIEHIPIESHLKLFAKLRSFLKDEGFIIIHIPNPNFLAWCKENKQHVLQVIDQPIFTNELCLNIYPNDLYIHYLETYSIWQPNCDYQVIVLKSRSGANYFPEKIYVSTFMQKIVYKLKLVFGLKPG